MWLTIIFVEMFRLLSENSISSLCQKRVGRIAFGLKDSFFVCHKALTCLPLVLRQHSRAAEIALHGLPARP